MFPSKRYLLFEVQQFLNCVREISLGVNLLFNLDLLTILRVTPLVSRLLSRIKRGEIADNNLLTLRKKGRDDSE